MPILGYFAVTAPMLLSALLLISAYLEPNRADNIAALFRINPVRAEIKSAVDQSYDRISIYHTLRARPIR